MLRTTKTMRRVRVHAVDGDVGALHGLYFDDERWFVSHLTFDAGSWLARRRVLIPPESIRRITWHSVDVELTREQLRASHAVAGAWPSLKRARENIQVQTPRAVHGVVHEFRVGPIGSLGLTPPREVRKLIQARSKQQFPTQTHLRSAAEVIGYHLDAADGVIGHVADFVFDDEDWSIRYVLVETRNWLPGNIVTMPTRCVTCIDSVTRKVAVDARREAIREAPEFDAQNADDHSFERCVLEHYYRFGATAMQRSRASCSSA